MLHSAHSAWLYANAKNASKISILATFSYDLHYFNMKKE